MYQIAQQLSQQVIVCVSLSSFSRLTCPSFSSAQLDQPMALLSRMAAAAAANRAVGTMLGAIVQGGPPYSRRRPPNGTYNFSGFSSTTPNHHHSIVAMAAADSGGGAPPFLVWRLWLPSYNGTRECSRAIHINDPSGLSLYRSAVCVSVCVRKRTTSE